MSKRRAGVHPGYDQDRVGAEFIQIFDLFLQTWAAERKLLNPEQTEQAVATRPDVQQADRDRGQDEAIQRKVNGCRRPP